MVSRRTETARQPDLGPCQLTQALGPPAFTVPWPSGFDAKHKKVYYVMVLDKCHTI